MTISSSEVGSYDRVVIQEIIKEIAQTQQVDVSAKHRFKGASHFLLCSQPRLDHRNSGHHQ